jgi:hypothetical protein
MAGPATLATLASSGGSGGGGLGFDVRFDEREMAYLQAKLRLTPKQLDLALKTAKNKTANWGRTRVRVGTQRRLNVKRKRINEAVRSRMARSALEAAAVTVDRVGLPLKEFKPVVSKSAGVTVTLDPARGSLTLAHAFQAKMKSGHIGIFLRRKLGPASAAQILKSQQEEDQAFEGRNGRTAYSGMFQEQIKARAEMLAGKGFYRIKGTRGRGGYVRKVTPEGFASRLPLDETYGPNVLSQLIGGGQLTSLGQESFRDIGDKYLQYLSSQVSFVLSTRGERAIAAGDERAARGQEEPDGFGR